MEYCLNQSPNVYKVLIDRTEHHQMKDVNYQVVNVVILCYESIYDNIFANKWDF